MTDSILTSIKKLMGIEEDYTHFDPDLIMHINAVLAILTQLGVGPPEGFSIADASAVWGDFIGTRVDLQAVVSYVYMKTRLMFDPPVSSAALESMTRLCSEFEWRLNVMDDPKKEEAEEETEGDM